MTDLYQMTWQRKDDDQAPVLTGPVLIHREVNPYWKEKDTPYTRKEALSAVGKWDRICSNHKHEIILVTPIKEVD